jgi:hypothetical protein
MEIVSFKPGDNGMPVYYYDNYNIDALNGGGGKVTLEAEAESIVAPEEQLQQEDEEVDNIMAMLTDKVEVNEPEPTPEPEPVLMAEEASKTEEPEKKKKLSAVRRVFGNFFGQ